jgi:hypothetical protein
VDSLSILADASKSLAITIETHRIHYVLFIFIDITSILYHMMKRMSNTSKTLTERPANPINFPDLDEDIVFPSKRPNQTLHSLSYRDQKGLSGESDFHLFEFSSVQTPQAVKLIRPIPTPVSEVKRYVMLNYSKAELKEYCKLSTCMEGIFCGEELVLDDYDVRYKKMRNTANHEEYFDQNDEKKSNYSLDCRLFDEMALL